MTNRFDFVIVQEKTDLVIQKDGLNVRFLQVCERNIEVFGQSGMKKAVSILVKSPALFRELGEQVEDAFFKAGIFDMLIYFFFRYAAFLFNQ